jgi:hypothetical protein
VLLQVLPAGRVLIYQIRGAKALNMRSTLKKMGVGELKSPFAKGGFRGIIRA